MTKLQLAIETDTLTIEDLEAAAEMFDRLRAGTFYQLEEEAREWLRQHRRESARETTRRAVERRYWWEPDGRQTE
jgi:hypothetical protein